MRIAYIEDGDWTVAEVYRASYYDSYYDKDVDIKVTGIIFNLINDMENGNELIVGMDKLDAEHSLERLMSNGFVDLTSYDEAVYHGEITVDSDTCRSGSFDSTVNKMG